MTKTVIIIAKGYNLQITYQYIPDDSIEIVLKNNSLNLIITKVIHEYIGLVNVTYYDRNFYIEGCLCVYITLTIYSKILDFTYGIVW